MWVHVDDELPALGERVRVHGAHTPDGTGKPVAYRRADPLARGGWRWESDQWRGTAGVTWWWRPEPGDEPEGDGA